MTRINANGSDREPSSFFLIRAHSRHSRANLLLSVADKQWKSDLRVPGRERLTFCPGAGDCRQMIKRGCPRMTRINANGSDREPSSFFLIRAHSRHSRANLLLSVADKQWVSDLRVPGRERPTFCPGAGDCRQMVKRGCPRMTRINANGSDREPSSFFLIRAHSRHSRANLLLSDVDKRWKSDLRVPDWERLTFCPGAGDCRQMVKRGCPRMTRINANGSDREPSSFFLIRAHSRHSRANLLLSVADKQWVSDLRVPGRERPTFCPGAGDCRQMVKRGCPRMTRINANGSDREPSSFFLIRAHSRHSRANLLLSVADKQWKSDLRVPGQERLAFLSWGWLLPVWQVI